MKQEGLVSSYTTAQFKPQKDRCNESKVENVLNLSLIHISMDYINLLHASGMYEKQTAKIIPFRSIDIRCV